MTWYDLPSDFQLRCAKIAHDYYVSHQTEVIAMAEQADAPMAPESQIARWPSDWSGKNWLWYIREKQRGSSFVWTNPMTTNEWVEQNAEDLRSDIATHIEVMTGLAGEENDRLVRLIMISVRQWDNFRRGKQ